MVLIVSRGASPLSLNVFKLRLVVSGSGCACMCVLECAYVSLHIPICVHLFVNVFTWMDMKYLWICMNVYECVNLGREVV